MATPTEVLRDIGHVRRELTDLREQIKRAPLQLNVRQAEIDKQAALIAAENEAAKQMRMDADARELTLKQSESRIGDLKVKLNQAASNKEYQVIQDEIKRIESDDDKLQDEILEKITEEEAKREEIKGHEAELDRLKQEFAKFKEVLDYKTQKQEEQVSILEAKLKELEPNLGEVFGDYRRLTASKGDEGIAECRDGTCQNCFSSQPPQSWQEILSGRPVRCKNCGALMFKG